ncbi:hypothetical protein GC174_14820 [bacterium]|nr:hypothetical protein [bacterium]
MYVKRPDFAPDYWISACGKLFSTKRRLQEVKGWLDNKGYRRVRLRQPGFQPLQLRLHQIVAWAFTSPPEEGQYIVRHLDNNKRNNARWNLKWGTALQNSWDTYK